MSIDTCQIGNRAWSFAHVLRDDGLSYQAYIEHITFLLFLKMADELTKPPHNREPLVPAPYGIPGTRITALVSRAVLPRPCFTGPVWGR